MENNHKLTPWKGWLTLAFRLIVGTTFIFSGFVKAIDPWGTIYKFNDYLGAMHFDVWDNLVLIGVFVLFSIEFIIGIFIILGCDRRLTTILASLIMLFMLPLSLWVAVSDPVSDCGCFGDALIISNWATFWKNVILTAMIVWLDLYNHKYRYFVIPEIHWIVFLATGFYINVIGLFGYIYQPLIDFRPYKIGETLIDSEETDSEEEFEFIYSYNGEEHSFSTDNIPSDDEWEFVERRQIKKSDNQETSKIEKQLTIYDAEEDMTHSVILDEGEQLILFYPSLSSYSIASTYQINSLQEYCNRNDIDMIAIVPGSENQIAEFVDLSMATYPIYTAEDTSIKEVVRGCPAIIYLRDGIIMWKSTLRAINNDDFLSENTAKDPMLFAFDNKKILHVTTWSYVGLLLLMVTLSHVPKAVRYAKQKAYFKKFVKDTNQEQEPDKTEKCGSISEENK